MYKLSEVAKKLNVEKVLLFELLLTKGEYLVGNVEKKYGVTYLSDSGIEIIDKIIRGEEIDILQESQLEKEEFDLSESEEKIEGNLEPGIIKNEGVEDIYETDDTQVELAFKSDLEKNIEIDDDSNIDFKNEKNDEVKNLEILTGKSKFSKFEKEEKRNRISKLRNDFVLLDSEIRKKQEAIESYDKILEEDIQWVCILEDKLSIKLKERLSEDDKDVHQKRVMEKMFFKK